MTNLEFKMKQISDDIFEFFQIQSAITIWVRFLWRNVKLYYNDCDIIQYEVNNLIHKVQINKIVLLISFLMHSMTH